jgi:hypothetical protein
MKTPATALVLLFLAAGCGGPGNQLAPPDGDADYSGAVVQVADGSVLVRADGDTCGIWVSQAESVEVLGAVGESFIGMSWGDIQPGATVDLWVPGGIAESCPMQGAAEAVLIVDDGPRPPAQQDFATTEEETP